MSIKLSSLKKNDIRRKIVFTNQEGEKEIITVKNPDNESKVKLMEFLAGRIGDNDTEITIEPKDILVNLLPSKGEARRLIQQGGLLVNDEKVTNIGLMISKEQLVEGVKVKKGKKVYHKVIIK